MTFQELISDFTDRLGCSISELAEASELTPSALSRYRSGLRRPRPEALQRLADGIASIAAQKGISGLESEDVYNRLVRAVGYADIDSSVFAENFSSLVDRLSISLNRLAKSMDIDASLLSRFKRGERVPIDMDRFIGNLSSYLLRSSDESGQLPLLCATLGGITEHSIRDEGRLCAAVDRYLRGSPRSAAVASGVSDYLHKLDEFDLGEYISIIRFDKLKIPTAPFAFPASRHYYGVEDMKRAELAFLRATAISQSKKPLFMNSNMPISDMVDSEDFNKKWMFGIAACIKKGLHLNIIHTIDRPMKEMLLGLQAWMPIYMTGQVSPYYLPQPPSAIYHELLYVSGAAALRGECISGHHANGQYYFTNSRRELAYYRQRSEDILSKALPLMEIFDSASEDEYRSFFSSESSNGGQRCNMLSTLPIYTLSEELLTSILSRNSISSRERERLTAYLKWTKECFAEQLISSEVLDIIPVPSEEQFSSAPLLLSLSGAFFEREIQYTYEEYTEHCRLTRELSAANSSYSISELRTSVFRNIQIQMKRDEWVMVSKSKSPAIHFIIRHPKMLNAFEKGLFATPNRISHNSRT